MMNWRKKLLVFINLRMNWYVNKCGFCIQTRTSCHKGVELRLANTKLRMRSQKYIEAPNESIALTET
jgi:ATP sulfurylase